MAGPCTMCEVLTLLPHGKRCCSYKKCLYISIYIRICIYVYIHAYTLFLCQRQWKEYHNQEMGVEVLEKIEWYTRTMLLLLLSKPRPVLQSLCFTPSLLPPSPFIFYSFSLSLPSTPTLPSILFSFLSSFYCECFLCSLQAVSRDFWSLCSANCMRAVGLGWAGLWRGCDDV